MGLVALVVLMAGAGTAYANLEKKVVLEVDGDRREVRTFGSSVGDILDAEGILLEQHDEVTPPVGSSLSDGMVIEVALAKEITLVLNGEERTIMVTGATVDDVLEQINFRASSNAYLEPSRGEAVEHGDVIVYKDAVQVELTVEGKTRKIITNAVDVAQLLDSLAIEVRARDIVEPKPRAEIAEGMSIRVVRVGFRRVVEEERIAFETQVRSSSKMYEDQRRVAREGSDGLVRKVYRIRMEDGKEIRRSLQRSKVVREPVTELIVQGTRKRPVRTESGIASWYHRNGMVAAHKTLPFGTNVTVVNVANGRRVTVVINDRGPFIAGRIIDLSDDAFAELAPLGAGTIQVRISW